MRERITLPYFAESDCALLIVHRKGGTRIVGATKGDCFVVDPQNGDVHHNHSVVCKIDNIEGIVATDEDIRPDTPLDELIMLARGLLPAKGIADLALSDLVHRFATAVCAWNMDPGQVATEIIAGFEQFEAMTSNERLKGSR